MPWFHGFIFNFYIKRNHSDIRLLFFLRFWTFFFLYSCIEVVGKCFIENISTIDDSSWLSTTFDISWFIFFWSFIFLFSNWLPSSTFDDISWIDLLVQFLCLKGVWISFYIVTFSGFICWSFPCQIFFTPSHVSMFFILSKFGFDWWIYSTNLFSFILSKIT